MDRHSRNFGKYSVNHFYKEETSEFINSAKFKIGVFRNVFTVKNIEDAPEGSDQLLEDLIDYFIAKADKATDSKAERCSIIIRSAVLEKPIQIPYRGLAQNTPQVVMEQLDSVDQSGKRMGRPSIFSQPIYIEIVMGPSHEEALELIQKGSSGSGRRPRYIMKGIDRNNLIEVRNDDLGEHAKNHCLLLAVQLTLLYVNMVKTTRANVNFLNLIRGKGESAKLYRCKLIKDMLTQMEKHGINYSPNLSHYSVEEHVPLIQKYFNEKFPGEYRLAVFGEEGHMTPLWKGADRAKKDICLYLMDGHYYGIRKLNTLFGKHMYYCLECEATYHNKNEHRQTCAAKCPRCCGMGADFPCKEIENYEINCPECFNLFRNPSCFERHIEKGICQIFKRCKECGQIYRVNNNEEHICYVRFCSLCRSRHRRDEKCYVQPIVPKHSQTYLMIVFDFECELISSSKNTDDSSSRDENYQLHHVNCVSAMLLCSTCMQNNNWKEKYTGACKTCGPGIPRMRTWTGANYKNPLREFLEWIIFGLDNKRKGRTLAISHYGGRYDMHLLLGELIKHFGIEPNITRTGNKLYEVLIKKKNGIYPYISFRDSFNWMMLKLDQLPKALGLDIDEGGKSFFPHGWNLNKNMDILLKNLPAKKYYYPETMGKQRRKEFEEWYDMHKDGSFLLCEQIVEYCEQDVRILTHALVRLQKLFFELATESSKRDDVLVSSMTLASACLRHFCINYLKSNQIGIIPDNGYHKDTNYSAISIKFIKWLEHKTGLQIQNRQSAEGEYRITASNGSVLRLDGFIKEKNIAIEFLGCAWHGHKCLYRPHEICLNGKTALYNDDTLNERITLLKNENIRTYIFWECEVVKALENNPQMSLFFDELPDIGPLFPRDAFHGGRTAPLSLKCNLEGDVENEYEISCYDVVSLYPAVNFYAFYPIGHPEVWDLNLDINWTKPEDLRPYRGIFKLFIIPPDDLYLPVIPERIHGKLIFHLCHQCAIEIESGVAKRKQNSYSYERKWCQHNDKQRGFVSTTCSVELELALSRGYRATKVYSIYHWEEWSDKLLRPYVKDMMRLKIEASGWPASVINPDDLEKQERLKNEFIEKNQKEYGINLDPSKIARNEGLRYLAKTCNNSMWGRWALRCNLTQDCITSSPMKLHTILNDPKLELGAIEMLTTDMFAVPYKNRSEFIRPHDKYNIVLALITTATARVMLYDFMEKIVNDNECKLLYTDTDSCFFVHKRNKKPPFRVGDMLGMMSREYEEWSIISFYTGGCKQYAMKMKHRETGEIKYIVKCRGLWEQVDTPLDFNQFRKMVEAYGEEQDPVVLQRTHFQPNWRQGQVTSRTQIRRYTPIYDKGHVDANFDCYPYGYRGEPINDPTK
uniref:DNA-directed DNA polymerase n=2 Tax=Meloidogyne TaxID=189290 RepID=A0A914MNU5_MELIC